MAIQQNPLEFVVRLYREIKPELNGDNWVGVLPNDFEYSFDEVEEFLGNKECLGAEINERTRQLSFYHKDCFQSLDYFLRASSRRVNSVNNFYIAELDYFSPYDKHKEPVKIANYLSFCKLFQALKKVADDERDNNQTLIFLNTHKLEISSEYNESDLIGLDNLGAFEDEFCTSTTHVEQKHAIIKNVLFNLFPNKHKISLADVASKFSDFVEKVKSSYQLYMAEFSFEKIKAQVEREKLEFTTRLNKIFSDIQNQLLAIPVSLVLVGGQMQPEKQLTLANSLICIGAVLFAVIVYMLVSNQRNTLDAIKSEIDMQWSLVNGKHKTVADQFTDSYDALKRRYDKLKTMLCWINFFVLIGALFSISLLLHYSQINLANLGVIATETICEIINMLRSGLVFYITDLIKVLVNFYITALTAVDCLALRITIQPCFRLDAG